MVKVFYRILSLNGSSVGNVKYCEIKNWGLPELNIIPRNIVTLMEILMFFFPIIIYHSILSSLFSVLEIRLWVVHNENDVIFK